jgi:hypothetical protein
VRWKQASEKIGAEVVWYEGCNHYLMGCDQPPGQYAYMMSERHVSDVALRSHSGSDRRRATTLSEIVICDFPVSGK